MSTDPSGPPPQPSPRGISRRSRTVLVPVVAVLVIVVAIGLGVVARTALAREIPGTATAAGAATSAAHVLDNGAVRVGDPHAKVTVRVVMDLQCPACKMFEAANGSVLTDAVRNGTAAVEYSVITFLDRASTTQYSSRAGNSSFCVANEGVEHYQSWLSEMFTRQPEEGGDGLTDDELVGIARSAGYADAAVAQCITARAYDNYLRIKTKEVLAGGVTSTPTVSVNGQQITDSTALLRPNGLAAVIAAAS
ncbi:DsbA family protein [Nocardia spumae]|uniref:DsbA family protein n=1 Tax=Nocardia spumae TaxID=2887190 RepID=UPI001D1352CB|nr:thioredoxin domain-containing protein [Nocardia spumae]